MSDLLEKTEADLRKARVRDDAAARSFLGVRGWRYTCATRGSYWMWEKVLDGKTYLVSREDALRLEGFHL